MAEKFDGKAPNGGIHGLKQIEAGIGDLRPHNAAIVPVAVLPDQLEAFEASEEAGNVRLGGEHARADCCAGEAFGPGAAQDAQDIVLG